MVRALVTGASGFIGGHLVQALAERGDQVVAMVRKTALADSLRPYCARVVSGDVNDVESLRSAVAGAEVVYHLAGCTLRRTDFHRINAEGTENVARACAAQASPPVLVIASSLAAAGPAPNGRSRTELDRPTQVSEYGRSKRAGELAAQQLAARVPISVIRPPIVFGEMDRVTFLMFHSVARFGVHMVPGLGRPRYSLIHADDLSRLFILAAERGARLRPAEEDHASCEGYYFAAAEEDLTYDDFGRMIAATFHRRRVATIHCCTSLIWMIAGCSDLVARLRGQTTPLNPDKAWEMTAGSWICSAQRAGNELGFDVAAPLADRLQQTSDWYRGQGWL
jgi:nucleoside-diphosphate-sugar epimerase